MNRRRNTAAASHKRTLDTQIRVYVKERDQWTCQASGLWGVECWGTREDLEAAHLGWPRRHLSVRFDPDNIWTLCPAHHRWADTHAVDRLALLAEKLGPDRLALLRERALTPWPGSSQYPELRRQVRTLLGGGE